LVEGMPTCFDAARFGRLDCDTRAAEVAGDDVAVRVNELVHRIGIAPDMLPFRDGRKGFFPAGALGKD
jgi:hypothetical protein